MRKMESSGAGTGLSWRTARCVPGLEGLLDQNMGHLHPGEMRLLLISKTASHQAVQAMTPLPQNPGSRDYGQAAPHPDSNHFLEWPGVFSDAVNESVSSYGHARPVETSPS